MKVMKTGQNVRQLAYYFHTPVSGTSKAVRFLTITSSTKWIKATFSCLCEAMHVHEYLDSISSVAYLVPTIECNFFFCCLH